MTPRLNLLFYGPGGYVLLSPQRLPHATRRVSDSLPDPTRRGADSLASKCGPVFVSCPFPSFLNPLIFLFIPLRRRRDPDTGESTRGGSPWSRSLSTPETVQDGRRGARPTRATSYLVPVCTCGGPALPAGRVPCSGVWFPLHCPQECTASPQVSPTAWLPENSRRAAGEDGSSGLGREATLSSMRVCFPTLPRFPPVVHVFADNLVRRLEQLPF